jgi:alpha-tubulin suppressor-like RCC1 family protein
MTREGLETARRWAGPAVLILVGTGLCSAVAAQPPALAASLAAVSVSAGGSHSCVLESGKAYCWGSDANGELGDGTTADSSAPVAVDTSGALAGKTLIQISAGGAVTCALDSAGAAYCWGFNGNSELGDGTTADSSVPVAVDTSGALAGKRLTQISTGDTEACAVDSAGAAYCWGDNEWGELGGGIPAHDSDVPVAVDTSGVLAGKTITQVTAGVLSACALDSAGSAYCWGDNQLGELGNNSTARQYSPVAVYAGGVLAGKTLTQVSAGDLDACAVDSAGAAYCWGDNQWGELGDGTTSDAPQATPVAVDTGGRLAGKNLTQITVAGSDTCALDDNGAAYCWGYGPDGVLGDDSAASSSVPVAVDVSGALAGKTLTQLSAGDPHVCALDTSGATYCWGDNVSGDLGDGSSTQSNVPMLAGPQPPSGVTAASGDTSAAVSWTEPASLDGTTLTGYTATASPGGQACSTTGAVSCTISGLATGTTYDITVVTHTTAGDSGTSQPVTVTPGGTLSFSSAAADTVTFGAAFNFTVTTAGSLAPTITSTGNLPPGVHFIRDAKGTATISGTPGGSAAGVYPLMITARNKTATASQAFTLTVTRAAAIKKIPATKATVGTVLNLAITATGFPAPGLTQSGPLPSGVTFNDNGDGTASLAGTPATGTGGSYPVTVTAANATGSASTGFTLTVDQAPAITSVAFTSTQAGSGFSFQVTVTGYPAPKITESGTLPKGVTFHSATRTFGGTPKAGTSGSYPVTITARNAADTVTQNFTLTVTTGSTGRLDNLSRLAGELTR